MELVLHPGAAGNDISGPDKPRLETYLRGDERGASGSMFGLFRSNVPSGVHNVMTALGRIGIDHGRGSEDAGKAHLSSGAVIEVHRVLVAHTPAVVGDLLPGHLVDVGRRLVADFRHFPFVYLHI